jgi:hypothetical protein
LRGGLLAALAVAALNVPRPRAGRKAAPPGGRLLERQDLSVCGPGKPLFSNRTNRASMSATPTPRTENE